MLEAEYKYFFEDDSEDNNQLYDVQILNNIQISQGWFVNSIKTCEICGKSHKENCSFSFPKEESLKLKEIIAKMNGDRDLHLVLNWKANP